MRKRFGLVSALAVAVVLAGPAFAQQPRPAAPAPARQLNQQDMKFVNEAAAGGLAEVELGKLAQQNGGDEQVRSFGSRMVNDHGAANDELAKIASGKGMTVPNELDKQHMQLRDRLAGLRGDAFDRAYMREMTRDHDKDLKAFRREAQTAADPDIKQFAAKTAKVIEDHDRMAHQIDSSLAAVGSSHRPR